MPARRSLFRPALVALGVVACGVATSGAALAQDAGSHSSRQRIVHRRAVAETSPTFRGLTITRPPEEEPDQYSPDDIYTDGPIRYNDIRDFSPSPFVDSGRQFPFGFDGIGGYGSDLGYNEGQDAALYDRGAFNRPAR